MFKVKSKLFSKKSDSSSKADPKGENGEKPSKEAGQINKDGNKDDNNGDAPAADPIPTGLCKKLGSYFNDNPLNGIAAKRLMKEYEHCMKMSSGPEAPFTVELIDNALNKWNVQLRHIDKESKLYKDMIRLGVSHITLNILFPEDYPFAPPFLHVVWPRITRGYVLEGGAICMELLTKEGWSSVYTVEATIIQFSSQVVKGGGEILETSSEPYTKKDAYISFQRLSRQHEKHGWYTPPASEG
jgi:ubiquitin-conjugating enzyme E2 Q